MSETILNGGGKFVLDDGDKIEISEGEVLACDETKGRIQGTGSWTALKGPLQGAERIFNNRSEMAKLGAVAIGAAGTLSEKSLP